MNVSQVIDTKPQQSIALVPHEDYIAKAVGDVLALAEIVRRLRRDSFKEGHDYGIIPGTGEKPTLLLPGMEKLMRSLNAVPQYIEREVIRDYDKPLFHYEFECCLIDVESGQTIPGGNGLGMCTSYESSFRWRWVSADRIPKDLDKADLQTRNGTVKEFGFAVDGKETTGKYGKPAEYWQRFEDAIKNGTAVKIKMTSSKGKEYDGWEIGGIEYRIPNPDIFDQVNAILKRAKKRALGDAVKGAANISDLFTVDLDDFVEYVPMTTGKILVSDAEEGEIVDDARGVHTAEVGYNASVDIDDLSEAAVITMPARPGPTPGATPAPQGLPLVAWPTSESVRQLLDRTKREGGLIPGANDHEICLLANVTSVEDMSAKGWGQYETRNAAALVIRDNFNAKALQPATPKNGNGHKEPAKQETWSSSDLLAISNYCLDAFNMTADTMLQFLDIEDWTKLPTLGVAKNACKNKVLELGLPMVGYNVTRTSEQYMTLDTPEPIRVYGRAEFGGIGPVFAAVVDTWEVGETYELPEPVIAPWKRAEKGNSLTAEKGGLKSGLIDF